MQKSYRFVVSALLLGAFLLSACSGVIPTPGNDNGAPGANSNEVLDNSANANDANTNSSDDNSNGNANANSNDDMDDDQEFFGVVEVVTDTSITINGVTYAIADFTEFKDLISAGDEVKIHVIVNADGTFTIREIELSSGDDDNSNDDNSNSNTNGNSNDDSNSNDDDSNSNDDNSNDDSNSNDDDNSNGDDNSNDDNSNDDNDNDSNSNG